MLRFGKLRAYRLLRFTAHVLFLLVALFAASSTAHAVGLTTYLGGSGDDVIYDVAVDPAGDLWVVGETSSADFPGLRVPSSAAPDGPRNAFVVRLHYDGDWRVAEALLLGGSGNDRALRAVATGGLLIVAGETDSTDFPATRDLAPAAAGRSLFVATIDLASPATHQAAVLGGPGSEELAALVDLDEAGCVAVAATTDSADIAASGATDALLQTVCADPGGALRASVPVRFGGTEEDRAVSLLRRPGGFCLSGTTRSPGLPVTPDAGQAYLAVGLDGFVACYQTPDGALGSAPEPTAVSYLGAGGASVTAFLADYPDASEELLVVASSDSPVRLFDSAEPALMVGAMTDNPGSNTSLAFGGVSADLSGSSRRFWVGSPALDRLSGLTSDGGACVFALAEIDAAAAVVRLCATDGAGGLTIRHAQTVPLDTARFGSSFTPLGLSAAPVLAARGVQQGGVAIWGAASATADGSGPAISAGAPQPNFGGGSTDGLLRLQLFPFLTTDAVVGAADFDGGSIAAGQMVAIFGSGIGAEQILHGSVDAQTDRLSTHLGPTRVLVDGIEAPLNFTSFNQVGSVIPFGVNGHVAATLVVEHDGTPSNPLTLGVADAAPGVFTTDQSGVGQAAASNQDFSLNSAGNPAGRGTVLSLFMSGCGQTNPAGRDGAIAPFQAPLPELIHGAAVGLGDVFADVLYAGAAPGLLEGLCQVNVRVPPDAPVGQAPLRVIVGGNESRTGVTVAVAQTGGGDPGDFSGNPAEIRSCSELCGGLRSLYGLLEELLGVPSVLTQKGDACECFAPPFPSRDY